MNLNGQTLRLLKLRVLKKPEIPEERLTALLPLCCSVHILELAKHLSGGTFAQVLMTASPRQELRNIRQEACELVCLLLTAMLLRENHQENCGI